MTFQWRHTLATGALLLGQCLAPAHAQEAQIRKNLSARLSDMPKIDEVSPTPVAGLYEVRMGNDIVYTDAQGHHLIQGTLIDVRTRRNLTEERQDKLSAIAWDQLPLKNAFTQVRGNGKRRLAVWADPNCGYCKRFEKDLQKLDNVTIYHLLYPILGEDSQTKSRHIWCAKDRARAWNDWMIGGTPAPAPAASCDASVLEANVAFGKKHRISGTPTLFFADGTRVVGAVPLAQIEHTLAQVK